MQKLPFSLTTRANSPYYYVRFRNERTGKFMSWLSTKEKTYSRALRVAWNMYNEKAAEINTMSFYDTMHKSEYTKEDVQKFLEDFQRKGFLSGYVLNDGGLLNVPAIEWLVDFCPVVGWVGKQYYFIDFVDDLHRDGGAAATPILRESCNDICSIRKWVDGDAFRGFAR